MSKPSAIGLHHAVLDAVVDHLDEVAGAARPGMQVALLGAGVAALAAARWRGCRRVPGASAREDRDRAARTDRLLAADHQAVAALEPPHAAAGADVEVVRGPSACSSPARRTSSFQKVLPPSMMVSPGASSRPSSRDRRLGRRARRQHHPHGARRVERRDQLGEAGRRRRPLARQRPPRRRIAVIAPRRRARAACSRRAMLAPIRPKPDHADLHGGPQERARRGGARLAGDEREPCGGVNRRLDAPARVP